MASIITINIIHIAIALLLLSTNLINNITMQKVVYIGLIALSSIVILYQGNHLIRSYNLKNSISFHSFINFFHVLIGIYLIYISSVNLRNFDNNNFIIVQRILTLLAIMMISVHSYLIYTKTKN